MYKDIEDEGVPPRLYHPSAGSGASVTPPKVVTTLGPLTQRVAPKSDKKTAISTGAK